MKTLIIGRGEIGTALYNLLSPHYKTYIRDISPIGELSGVEVLHICFPYSKDFIDQVREYQEEYEPEYTIIHSTVPLGTSRQCDAYYSPVRGLHPNLENSLKTFIKFLAPPSIRLKDYFENAGIPIMLLDKQEEGEALKLWSLVQYGWNIVLEKEIYKWCQEKGLDFNIVYTQANKTYNEGYEKLGRKDVLRPVLRHQPGKIGGHCIIPNTKLVDSKVAKIILKFNKKYGLQ